MKMKNLLILMIASLSVFAAAQGEKPGLRKEMEAYYAKVDTLIETGNMKGFWALFAPGYYMVDTDGKRMDMAGYKAMVNGMGASMKIVDSTIRVKNVQFQDKELVVWVQQEMTWKQQFEGRWKTMKSTTRWAENLVMVGGSWKFKSSQQLMTNEPWTFKTNG